MVHFYFPSSSYSSLFTFIFKPLCFTFLYLTFFLPNLFYLYYFYFYNFFLYVFNIFTSFLTILQNLIYSCFNMFLLWNAPLFHITSFIACFNLYFSQLYFPISLFAVYILLSHDSPLYSHVSLFSLYPYISYSYRFAMLFLGTLVISGMLCSP